MNLFRVLMASALPFFGVAACSGSNGTGGAGMPTILASGQATPTDIALDGTNVYWTNVGSNTIGQSNGTIMKVPKSGGSLTQLASGWLFSGGAQGLATDSAFVYWLTTTALMRVPVSGGTPTELVSGSFNVDSAVATDASSVNYSTGGFDAAAGVYRISAAGGSPMPVATGQSSPSALALDASSVYWINRLPGELWKAPLAGGAATMLASITGDSDPLIALDASNVYWALNGLLKKVSKSGGAQIDLGQDFGSWNLVADETSLYWVDGTFGPDNAGSVLKMPLSGGRAVMLASHQNYPAGIAVDATHVYWANRGTSTNGQSNNDGTIMKMESSGPL